jgi:hypothetical protein
MDQVQKSAEEFLAENGFRREHVDRLVYWVRLAGGTTRQCVAMGPGYIKSETLFSLWIEKPDLFLKYLPHGQEGYLDMAHADLAKDGLHRVGASGKRGWTSSESEAAIEALRTIGVSWLDQHVAAESLIETVEAGQCDGPLQPPKRRLFGLLDAKIAVTASAYELTPIDKQRLGNLYLELGRLHEAHRWYTEYLEMMNYLTESNPRNGVWVEALTKLRNEAGE